MKYKGVSWARVFKLNHDIMNDTDTYLSLQVNVVVRLS